LTRAIKVDGSRQRQRALDAKRDEPALGAEEEGVSMIDLKIMTALMVAVGIIVNFVDRWFAFRSPCMSWLAWFLGSVPAVLYIVLDYLQQSRRFFQ
jgi:hypothetical protein